MPCFSSSPDPLPSMERECIDFLRDYQFQKEEKMKTRLKATILAGAFLMATAIPMTALAGPRARTKGQTVRRQTPTMNQTGARDRDRDRDRDNDRDRNRNGDRQRLRDGSCLDPANERSGAMKKEGYTYGPGDGTGNETPPQDGSGYGAPSQR